MANCKTDKYRRTRSLYREKNREKIRLYNRDYKRKLRGYPRKRVKKEVNPMYQRDYLRNARMSAIEALGGKCIRCGFDDYRALQIDHINGGGSKERKERNYKGNFYKHVLKSFLANDNKYQLLCANCNWIKRFENKER